MYASSNADHTDTFDGDSFEIKRECNEMADSPSDADSIEVTDTVMSGGGKKNGARVHKQRSFVWKHFMTRGSDALCKLCRKTMKRSKSNTSNLLKHLERDHPKEHVVVMEETGRRMMEEATRTMVQ